MAELEHYFRELVEGKRQTSRDRVLLTLLRVISVPYGAVMRLRALLYRLGVLTSHRLVTPVVSVGNLTVGGTGKTPTVAFIARFFIARGKRVVVLSRGYGGSAHGSTLVVSDGESIFLTAAEAGDEPYLLAATIPGLGVVIGPDRYRAGKLAEERLRPDLLILDDGFQHQRLKRDLDILLLDCRNPYGNGRLLPAGLLREPPEAAARADVVIYTRCSGKAPASHASYNTVCRSDHSLAGIVNPGTGGVQPFDTVSGSRIMAFAGIADPSRFFDALEDNGVRLITTLAFPDHAAYGEEEIAALVRLRDASRATCLLTTEKDMVKLSPWFEKLGRVHAVRLELRFEDDLPLREKLEKLL